MPPRNMGRVKNLGSRQAFVWIPPGAVATYKITVERDDGTIDDITDVIMSFDINDGVTDVIGIFSFKVPNNAEQYTGLWDGMETFRYYADYDAVATTLRFKGRLEKVSYRNNMVEVTGRAEVLFVVEKTVNKTYSSADIGFIISDLFTTYGEGRFDFSGVNTATGTVLTISWSQKPFWDCIKDVCNSGGYDCYVDCTDVVQFFLRGSVVNAVEGIVHDYNLMDVGEFARDIQATKNKVIVYGADVEGVQALATAEDSESQVTLGRGVREYVITDDNITTVGEAQEVADFELSRLKDPPLSGELTCVLLATIQPGEAVYASSPENNIPPAAYTMTQHKHTLGEGKYETKVTIEREPRKLGRIIKRRIEAENSLRNTSSNPFGLSYSKIFLFNVDEGTHSSTQITKSVLKTTAGSGTWVSGTTTIESNITSVYVIANGTAITGATFEVSCNGGALYQTVSLKTLTTMSSSIGRVLVVRVTFSSSTSEIDSLSVLYNRESA